MSDNILIRYTSLTGLNKDLKGCELCSLNVFRKTVGEGFERADIMLVGEAPDSKEEKEGRAGARLQLILDIIGIDRTCTYITNICKCYSKGGVDPTEIEARTCFAWLKNEIEIVKPKVLVALGDTARKNLWKFYTGKDFMTSEKKNNKISLVRGNFFELEDGLKLMPTFYPSFLDRNEHKYDNSILNDMIQAVTEVWGIGHGYYINKALVTLNNDSRLIINRGYTINIYKQIYSEE